MKKMTIITLALLLFTGCEDEITECEDEPSIYGTWQYQHTATIFREYTGNRYFYTFRRNGTFSSTKYSDPGCAGGTFLLDIDTHSDHAPVIILDYDDCEGLGSGNRNSRYSYILDGQHPDTSEGQLGLYPVYLQCDEQGCIYVSNCDEGCIDFFEKQNCEQELNDLNK